MAPQAKLRAAVIGVGFIGPTHIEGYQAAEGCDVVALCDVNRDRAQAVAAKYGVSRVYTDYQELLAAADVDVVSVCVPNVLHTPVTVAALEAGKHVLCEKPMAVNAEAAARMIEAAEKSGKKLGLSLQFRGFAASRRLKALIEAGELGTLYYGKVSMLRRKAIPRGWFHIREWSGGGPVLDLAPHVLDLTWWLMGQPLPTSATAATYDLLATSGQGSGTWGIGFQEGPPDVEDLAIALLRFDNGATIVMDVSWALHRGGEGNMCEVFGTRGGATLIPELRIYREIGGEPVDITPVMTGREENVSPIVDFVESIIQDRDSLCPARQGLQIMHMLDAIYASAANSRTEPVEQVSDLS